MSFHVAVCSRCAKNNLSASRDWMGLWLEERQNTMQDNNNVNLKFNSVDYLFLYLDLIYVYYNFSIIMFS